MSGRSDQWSDDTRAWFERRLGEPSFVIPEERSSSVDRGSPIRSLPEIADFRRQRGRASAAREASERSEREGAFGNATVAAEIRYSLLTKHYREGPVDAPTGTQVRHRTVPGSSYKISGCFAKLNYNREIN